MCYYQIRTANIKQIHQLLLMDTVPGPHRQLSYRPITQLLYAYKTLLSTAIRNILDSYD